MLGHPKPPKISIGLPVYNGENYLCEALDAILAQTFTDFELIISDNGSVDSTRSIIDRYAQQDSRIRAFYHPENKGGAHNFNFVFRRSSGEYFAWAAHDDLFERTFLEKACSVLDSDPLVILAYPQAIFIDEQSRPIGQDDEEGGSLENLIDDVADRFHQQLRKQIYWCHAIFGLMRREALAKTGLIGGFVSSDKALLRNLTLHGKIWKIPEPLLLRRDHAKRSVRAFPTIKERHYWFAAKADGLHELWFARYVYSHISDVFRSELDAATKMKCLNSIFTWSCWRSVRYFAQFVPNFIYKPMGGFYRSTRLGEFLAQRGSNNR